MKQKKFLAGLLVAVLCLTSIMQPNQISAQEQSSGRSDQATIALIFPQNEAQANTEEPLHDIVVLVKEFAEDGSLLRTFNNKEANELVFTKTLNSGEYEAKIKPGIYELNFNQAWDTNRFKITFSDKVNNSEYYRTSGDKFTATAGETRDRNITRFKYQANQRYAISIEDREHLPSIPEEPSAAVDPSLLIGFPQQAHEEAIKLVSFDIQKFTNDGTGFDEAFGTQKLRSEDRVVSLAHLEDGVYRIKIIGSDIHGIELNPNERDLSVEKPPYSKGLQTGRSLNIKVANGKLTKGIAVDLVFPYIPPVVSEEPRVPTPSEEEKKPNPGASYLLPFETIIESEGTEKDPRTLNYHGKFPIDDVVFGLFKDDAEVLGKLNKSRTHLKIENLEDGTYTLKQKDSARAKILWGGRVDTTLTLSVSNKVVSVTNPIKAFTVRQWTLNGEVGEEHLDGKGPRNLKGLVEIGMYVGPTKIKNISSCEGDSLNIGCLFHKLNPYENYLLKIENAETSLYKLKDTTAGTVYNYDWFLNTYGNEGVDATGKNIIFGDSPGMWGSYRIKGVGQDKLLRIADRFEISVMVNGFEDEVINAEEVQLEVLKHGVPYPTQFKIENNKLKFERLPIGVYGVIQKNRDTSTYRMEMDEWYIEVDDNGYATNLSKYDMKFNKVTPRKTTIFEFKNIVDENGSMHKASELQYGGVYPIDDVTFKLMRDGADVSHLMRKDRSQLSFDVLPMGSYTLSQVDSSNSKILWNNSLTQTFNFNVTADGVNVDQAEIASLFNFNLKKVEFAK